MSDRASVSAARFTENFTNWLSIHKPTATHAAWADTITQRCFVLVFMTESARL
jgi:hypothetical protein